MQPNDRVNPPAPADDDAEQPPGSSSLFTYLVLGVALLLYLQYRGWELDDYWSTTKAILGLGLVIFIHELGHFLVAKWCDVYVETFSIGFGPPLPGCHFQWGETTYMVALFPLGGYVKMLGEGTEADEADTDPRSFKNKTVLQRMAIICAGVIMNVVLALVCFVFVYMTRGAERMPGIIDTVDNGSALWKKGVHRGDVIYRIGDKVADAPRQFVWFEDLQPTVMLSQHGEHLAFVYGPPDVPPEKMTHTTIEPRFDKEEGDKKPVIGLAPPYQSKLLPLRASREVDLPFINDSAAARAEPPFKFGDTIIATTDPDQPSRITELPIDPRDPEGKRHDYFDFARRMERLAGKDVTMRVRRYRTADDDVDVVADRPAEEVDIKVPPAYRFVLGMRTGMAPITAVRDPAKEAGVEEGDIIESVEVVDKDGKTIRWVSTRSKDKKADVVEHDLDPERLPFELERWADKKPATLDVTLRVRRTNSAEGGRELKRIETIRVPYNNSWRYDREAPLGSSLSLSGLGIAYRVKTTIEGVAADRAAAKAVLESSTRLKYAKGDIFRIKPQKGDVVVRQGKTYKVEDGTLKEDEEFKLEEGDEVQRAGMDTVTLKDGAELRLDKGEVISLRTGDMIKEFRYYNRVNKRWSPPWSWFEKWSPRVVVVPTSWQKIGENQWASLGYALQVWDIKKLSLRVKRNTDTVEVTLQADEDNTWPVEERGYHLIRDSRLEKADGFGKAIAMGMDTTHGFIKQIIGNLYSVGTGRLSPTNFGGPIMIGNYAFNIAGTNFYLFVQFLGIISVNLAVINFLPIPVLDGGHMVFLIYEGVRGKPASEQVRVAATWVGLAFIVSLMLFVIYLDVMRQI